LKFDIASLWKQPGRDSEFEKAKIIEGSVWFGLLLEVPRKKTYSALLSYPHIKYNFQFQGVAI
jgi:hypothetical protein